MSRLHRAVAAATLLATVSSMFLAEPALAQAKSPAGYTVVAGDYLSGIAGKLGVSLSSLLAANHMAISSLILPGQQLVVPKGGVLPAVAIAATPARPARPKAYTVVAGDSLSGIAATLGVSLWSLLSTNQLQVTSLIYPGMTLTVPKGGHLPSTPGSKPAATPSTSKSPSTKGSGAAPLVYVVLAGDGLGLIAQKVGVTLAALLAANDLQASSMIYPGVRLTIPKGGHLPGVTPSVLPAQQSGGPLAIATMPKGVDPKLAPALAFALAQQGKAYQFDTAGPNTYDCSGLVMASFAEIGISLPHYSGAQVKYGQAIDWTKEPIKAGDLVFLESSPGSGIIDHVGIAISATQWIHAPRTGDVVRTGNIPMFRVAAVRRLVGA